MQSPLFANKFHNFLCASSGGKVGIDIGVKDGIGVLVVNGAEFGVIVSFWTVLLTGLVITIGEDVPTLLVDCVQPATSTTEIKKMNRKAFCIFMIPLRT